MKKFLLYWALFALPLVVVLSLYFITDPFRVLYHYDNYYETNGKGYYVSTNRTFVCTQMYMQNKDKYHYDSFILGNSRSGYYLVEDWKHYLPDSASCFHFDGYQESLYNVHKKMKFIDGKSPIRNVMLCIDHDLLIQDEQDYGHLYVLPPSLEKGNFFAFHTAFFRAYISPKFLPAYLSALLTNETLPYMFEDGIFVSYNNKGYKVDINELRGEKRMIHTIPESYYEEKSMIFHKQPDTATYGEPILKENQKQMLREIHEILVRNHTNYRVIINPKYNQLSLAREDMNFLTKLFGDNIVDFSGKNRLTDDYHHYYDPSHFNEYTASEVMRIAYEQNPQRLQNMLDSLYYK